MRISCCLVLAIAMSVCVVRAATEPEDPQITQAKQYLEKVQGLVDAGAMARMELSKAQQAVADAEDAAVLKRTLYGQELNEATADEMIAAAGRRFGRRKTAYDKQKDLVDKGVVNQASLEPLLQQMDLARTESDLADQRANTVQEIAASARAEQALEQEASADHPSSGSPSLPAWHGVTERYDGNGVFNTKLFATVETAFERKFGKPMPVSANGETAVHRALGFDHRGRVDVAIAPDQPEGVWLREYLTENHIPFFAFRQAVPGKATGAHIHLGPQSTKLALGG
jgi:hypothetical protein